MTTDVVTFGCRLNIHESEIIRQQANAAGLSDAAVINTCAVTSEAVRQTRQAIRKLRRAQPHTRIVVTGCAAQTDPHAFAAMDEVDAVVGNAEKLMPHTWRNLRAGAASRGETAVVVGDIMAVTTTALHPIDSLHGHARAFVQVQNGCDHRCTFCVIPFGRGSSRSVPLDDIVAQVRRLVERGYREVVLTGIDITSYGTGLPDAPTLGRLVTQILKHVPELERLRLSSIDSVEADGELLDAFADDARVMPHLHVSLQSGDDLILKRMKRRHSRAEAIAFCERMRRLRPDIVFGADIIAGFPTETEEMFARSLDIIAACGLTHLHVFPYSPRPGTAAARMPQVPHDIVKQRARRLRDAGDAALHRHLDAQIGARRSVVVEAGHLGRTEHFTPVQLDTPALRGTVIGVTIAGHNGRQLLTA